MARKNQTVKNQTARRNDMGGSTGAGWHAVLPDPSP
jgi:hypothetical protein